MNRNELNAIRARGEKDYSSESIYPEDRSGLAGDCVVPVIAVYERPRTKLPPVVASEGVIVDGPLYLPETTSH